jgi:class 3 adenylate cyclase
VVLVERESQVADSHEIAVLNDLALSAMMKDAAIRHLEGGAGLEIKVAGPLGIYAFEDPVAALEFAEGFRRVLAHDEIVSRIGIDVGPVLIFDLAGGGKDIAGMPVNIASKMAQDRGRWGHIYLSAAMHARVDAPGYAELRYTVSGVDLVVYEG